MPQSLVSVPAQGWIAAIAVGSTAKLRAQNIGGNPVIVQAFPNSAAPGAGAADGGIYLWSRDAWVFEFANDFPGVTTPTHIRFFGAEGAATVSVSHA